MNRALGLLQPVATIVLSPSKAFAALAGGSAKRPLLVLVLALALGAAFAVLATGLRPSADADTFVSPSSASYRATERFYRSFGEAPVQVVVKGSLQDLLLSEDVDKLLGLEGCLSGRVPAKALRSEGGVNGPCGKIARLHAVKVVIGPATFVNDAAEEIDAALERRRSAAEAQANSAAGYVRSQAIAHGHSPSEAASLARTARKANLTGFAAEVSALALRYGLTGPPSLSDSSFVSSLVFDSSAKTPGTPKRRFSYLFPSRDAALVSVRLRAGTSEATRERALKLIGEAVEMPLWKPHHGERYLLTGEPVIISALAKSISRSVLLLLVAVTIAMAFTLSFVFRWRPRLLPLALALLTVACTFGVLALGFGGRFGVGELAVLPVLTGLAVDYAIQLHSRVGEALAGGEEGIRRAVLVAARGGGPSLLAAACASAAAMLVLLLSPVPTVSSFSILLVGGIAIALLCAVTAGSAAIVVCHRRSAKLSSPGGADTSSRRGLGMSSAGDVGMSSRRGLRMSSRRGLRMSSRRGLRMSSRRGLRTIAASWRGAADLLRANPLTRAVPTVALSALPRKPKLTLAIALLLAAAGWSVSGSTPVQTDITKLVPQGTPSLRNLATLERLSGVGGEIDLMVSGAVAKPATIEWMARYEAAILKRFGYDSERGCGDARLCPAFSLPDLFEGLGRRKGANGAAKGKLTSAEVTALLRAIPPYFSAEVISPSDRVANLAFGVKLMPLAAEQRVIESMRRALHPPPGITAKLVGLPVLAAAADVSIASPSMRLIEMLLGLAAVAVVLGIAFRGDLRRALVPTLPVALASGWSALLVFLLRIPLNPMSVTLGVLVIAISTEFSVLLSERYRQERAQRCSHVEALQRAYRGTGAAVAASGATAIVGFGVLILSEIQMLREFGVVTLIDLAVSLIGVVIVLPAALTVAEQLHDRDLGAKAREGKGSPRRLFSSRLERASGEPSA